MTLDLLLSLTAFFALDMLCLGVAAWGRETVPLWSVIPPGGIIAFC